MSNRSRRSVVQPTSYKDFSESGHRDIPVGGRTNQQRLMEENSSEEGRSTSEGESQSTQSNLETDQPSYSECSRKARSRSRSRSSHASSSGRSNYVTGSRKPNSNSGDSSTIISFKRARTGQYHYNEVRQSDSMQPNVSSTTPAKRSVRINNKNSNHLHTKAGVALRRKKAESPPEDFIALKLNPEDDDLDRDRQVKSTHTIDLARPCHSDQIIKCRKNQTTENNQ